MRRILRKTSTVSMGVAGVKPDPEDPIEEMVERADRALYAAKQGGRKRVCVRHSRPQLSVEQRTVRLMKGSAVREAFVALSQRGGSASGP